MASRSTDVQREHAGFETGDLRTVRPATPGEAPGERPLGEIVVSCEGLGSGWFLETTFVEWSHGGFSAFVRRGNNGPNDAAASRRIATLKGTLTWRRVLHFIRRTKSLGVGSVARANMHITGVEPWAEELIAGVMARIGDQQAVRCSTLLTTLSDSRLERLHHGLAGLSSDLARDLLHHLVRGLKTAGYKGRMSLPQIASTFGVADPGDLVALLEAISGKTLIIEQSVTPSGEVVYWRIASSGHLVFASQKEAERVHQIHCAIESSKTWGEFKSRMPPQDFEEVVTRWLENRSEMGNDDEEEGVQLGPGYPKASTPFSSDEVPGYNDGDYPSWLQQDLDQYLPDEVLSELGQYATSCLQGGFWEIPRSSGRRLLEYLRLHGYSPVKRPDLRFW
jgi:hypothetical protein